MMGITKETPQQEAYFITILLLCYNHIIIQILLPFSMSYNYNHIFGDIILCDTSCDHSYMLLHYSRKEEYRIRKKEKKRTRV